MAKPGGGSRRSGAPTEARDPAVRLRTAKGRKPSSSEWLTRQLNDPYVSEARRRGFRSRAAFKLIELDARLRLLRPGLRVVDLGAAPGGWTQVLIERVRPAEGKGRVVAIDIQPMAPVAGAEFLHLDLLAPEAPETLRAALAGPADLVLSDMAAPSTGHAATDHRRIVALAEAAYDFAAVVLGPGGAFVAKVFQGGTERDLLARLKRDFTSVRHVKPPASRAESAEVYVVAQGFRGAGEGCAP